MLTTVPINKSKIPFTYHDNQLLQKRQLQAHVDREDLYQSSQSEGHTQLKTGIRKVMITETKII